MLAYILNLGGGALTTGGTTVMCPPQDNTERQDNQPFQAIWCQPSYGKKSTLVEWTLPVGYESGGVYVYRSFTGTSPWVCLNPANPVAATGNFEDELFVMDNHTQLAYYRLMLEHDNKRYGSPIINLLQQLSKSQYGAARLMLIKEMRGMMTGNGIQVYHFSLKPGDRSDIDKKTDQLVQVPCPGAGIEGFADPVLTWITLGETTTSMKDRPAGDGSDIDVTAPARMLSFPRPVRGHVLVDPISDDRYAVDTVTKDFRFRGIVTIAYAVSLRLLDRDDVRYRLAVPPTI